MVEERPAGARTALAPLTRRVGSAPEAIDGLSVAEVRDRMARGLGNALPDDTGRSFARILASNVFTVFNGIVGGSFVLLLVLGSWQDALFGFSVVANTVLGVVQEFRAKRTLRRLAIQNSPRVRVRRDGATHTCAVEDLVLDDILVLGPGEQLGADAVVLVGDELEVDESLLTGEADPVSSPAGRELLSGSTVSGGSGLARVVRVGTTSYAVRITIAARRFALVDSELRRSLGRVIRWLSVALIPISAIVVNGQMKAAGGWSTALASGAWREAAVASVASIIAMVPAGLVFITSVALALGAVRLARQRVLVGELAAVEGLARVDMLCIDKTGTLTEGGMTLDRVEPVGTPVAGWELALAALAAGPVANATTRAIAARFDRATLVPDGRVPFASRHKWSAVHFAAGASGTWVLGGADVVLDGRDRTTPTAAQVAALAEGGVRAVVLAHSTHPLPAVADARRPTLPPGLLPVAVLVLRERVRVDAAATMRFFDAQGVDVCVISGDDPVTVAAVAHDVGLSPHLSGVDARTLPADAGRLAAVMRSERVFGRVTPDQKRSMVTALQSLGYTVAMVGDGVNDTLALKQADLAIAMGSGSASARAVAHLVLLDGELARLPAVVAEGRRVLANAELLAKLFLTKTVYAVVLAVTFGVILWPFPLLPRQLSILDGLTIGLPALVLALLPNAPIYRLGFLRRAGRFVVPSGAVVALAVIAVVVGASVALGAAQAQVQTAAVITLALSALWVLVILARPFTRLTAVVVVSAYAGLVALFAVPFVRDFLRLEIPDAPVLLLALGVSVAASLVLELVRSRARAVPPPPRLRP